MLPYQEPYREPWPAPWRKPSRHPDPREMPDSLRTAVKLMYGGAVLTVVGLLLGLITGGPERERFSERNPGVTEDEVLNIQIFGGLIVGAIVVALWCWMARANRDGKLWARTTATVFGVIAILSGAFSLLAAAGDGALLDGLQSAIHTGLAIVILVLLYKPESTRYYYGAPEPRWSRPAGYAD